MWNMTIYKCKLKISRLEGETYLSLTENNSYCSKIVDEHQQKSLRLAHKNSVSRVSGNKQRCLRLT